MRTGNWTPMQWFNPDLVIVAEEIDALPKLISADNICSVNYAPQAFSSDFDYKLNVGDNPNSCCSVAEDIRQTIISYPDTEATLKPGKAVKLWQKATRLLITLRFSTTSSRLLAIYSEKPSFGSAYFAMTVKTPEQEKAFAVFLNSSFGIIQMLNRRTKKLTYPHYEVGHLKTLMLPDPNKADLAPLLAAFEKIKDTPLERLSKCAQDPARKTLDYAAADSIGVDPAITDQWREWLSQEPTITNKPYQF